jgi:carboxyl-terminal processing protease
MQNPFSAKAFQPLFYALCIVIGLIGGRFLYQGKTGFEFAGEGKGKVQDILKKVDEYYVDDIDIKALQEKTIASLLEQLDPHSHYISAEDMRFETEKMEGNFDGIGVEFRIINDTICVLHAIKGGPSAKAGVLAGDKIIRVNKSNFTGKKITTETAMNTLRGEKGSEVNLGVLRHKKQVNIPIIRGEIPINSIEVASILPNNTGYIKISIFSKKTAQEFREAAILLQKQNIQHLIIDVRGNPGGIMESVIDVVDQLMEKGKLIVYTKSRKEEEKYFTKGEGLFTQIPIVVLVDENSASASEILAGAIQDNDRGTIMGRRTFGKGLVQRPFDLKDGSSLRLTIARYYTPVGRCIQRDYANGSEEYYGESSVRFSNGELTSKDSIHVVDSLKFKTPKGKIVYGGGGIIPDVFVPYDTIQYSMLFQQIVDSMLIEKFFIQQISTYLPKMKGLSIQLSLKVLQKSPLFNEFIAYAKLSPGIFWNEKQFLRSKVILENQLLGRFLKTKFDNLGHYYPSFLSDKAIQNALNSFRSTL